MRETWYVLEDGSCVDPNECAPDKSGALKHKSGAAVAMRGQTPSSRGVDPDEERKAGKGKPQKQDAPPEKVSKDLKPEPQKAGGYHTRENKAR